MALFFDKLMKFRRGYTRVQLLAAFISAWLCSYCIPIGPCAYIRPKVFMATASIAQGIRRSIGLASVAHFYSSVDDILHSNIENDSSASECELPLPMHFIMGWYACYCNASP